MKSSHSNSKLIDILRFIDDFIVIPLLVISLYQITKTLTISKPQENHIMETNPLISRMITYICLLNKSAEESYYFTYLAKKTF